MEGNMSGNSNGTEDHRDWVDIVRGVILLVAIFVLGIGVGSRLEYWQDLKQIDAAAANANTAIANEEQANALEDECKAVLNSRPASAVETQLIEDHDTGDWRFYIYGKRKMVCEEKAIRITNQGDAENPISLECRHAKP
jgi:5'-3' exonuclease